MVKPQKVENFKFGQIKCIAKHRTKDNENMNKRKESVEK